VYGLIAALVYLGPGYRFRVPLWPGSVSPSGLIRFMLTVELLITVTGLVNNLSFITHMGGLVAGLVTGLYIKKPSGLVR